MYVHEIIRRRMKIISCCIENIEKKPIRKVKRISICPKKKKKEREQRYRVHK